jgi:hypothetical protein
MKAQRDRYISTESLNPTVFPLAKEGDFNFYARRIKEQWRRFYPVIKLRRLKHFPTSLFDDATTPEAIAAAGDEEFKPITAINRKSGVNTGGTLVDPLYMESVPEGTSPYWQQPHSSVESPERDADEWNKYQNPIDVHVCLRVTVNEYVLKRWGIDEDFDIIAMFNTPELDERGILISVGDRFLWQGQEYEIHQRRPEGWWMHTDLFLHLICNCKRVRRGS